MVRAWRGSLQGRLMAGIIVLAALGMVTVNVASLAWLRIYLVEAADADLTQVRGAVQGLVASQTAPVTGTTLTSLVPEDGYIVLLDDHGRVVAQTPGRDPSGHAVLRPSLPTPVPNGFAEHAVTLSAEGALLPRYRALGFPVGQHAMFEPAPGTPAVPFAAVVVAKSLGTSEGVVYWLLGVDAVATLAALAGIAIACRVVVRVGMRPLRDMATTATAIAAGDLDQRIEIAQLRSELGDVGSALNRAFDARAQSEKRLRQFVADASHELRTPLTSIRGWAQLHLHGLARDPELVERAMLHIEREAARMHVMVEELLLLALLDQGLPLVTTPVDLGQLAALAVADTRALDPGRPITLEAPGGVFASGDEDRLLQVLRNLLGNALRHTPAGTPVSVAVRSLPDDRVELTVTDHGPGMDPDTAGMIFERLYRGDDSRSPSGGGAGLGLSIVKSIVEAHGGTVRVRTAAGEGSGFTVTLPAAH